MGVSFRMDGWLGNSGIQPDGEGAVGTGRAALGGAVSARRRGVGLFECSLVMAAVCSLSPLFSLSSLFLSILLSSSSRSEKFRPLSDLCNLVISSHSYDNKRNYLTFTFCRAILNSGGAPQ